jgi:hypothetical protein
LSDCPGSKNLRPGVRIAPSNNRPGQAVWCDEYIEE